MSAEASNWVIECGADFFKGVRLRQNGEFGPYYDLTDWTFWCQARQVPGGAIVTEFICTVDETDLAITLPSYITDTLAPQVVQVDLLAEMPNGVRLRLLETKARIKAAITVPDPV